MAPRSGQILRVCKTVYQEGIDYLYEEKTFIMSSIGLAKIQDLTDDTFLGRILHLSLNLDQLSSGNDGIWRFKSLKTLKISRLVLVNHRYVDLQSQIITRLKFWDDDESRPNFWIAFLPDVFATVL